MTADPLNWVSWREARDRMPEIWDGWRYQSSHADEALVNSLRRGNVPYRGKAREWESRGFLSATRRSVALRDVVAGLLSLRTRNYASLFAYEAEYEATEWGEVLGLGGYRSQPMTVKKTAILDGAELAWDEFRDDLIQQELPRGARPTPPRRSTSRRAVRQPRQPVPPKPASVDEIHGAIQDVYDAAAATKEKPPNVNEVIKPVQERLLAAGHQASGRRIRELAGEPRYAVRRRKPGMTTPKQSKKHEAMS